MWYQRCGDPCSTRELLPCEKCYPVLGRGQINIKIPTSTFSSSIQQMTGLQGSKIRSTTGFWTPSIDSVSHSYPQYIFALDSPHNNPFSTNHFLFLLLYILWIKNIHTYAFIDSGATNSHILNSLVSKHSLSWHHLPIPVRITAVNGWPLCSGLLMHKVLSTLHISDHTEHIHLGIVMFPHPIVLGLNWLQKHNLNIDWKEGKMN